MNLANSVFSSDAGDDVMIGARGNDVFFSDVGRDYNTGAGKDVILFNKGDGQDKPGCGQRPR